MRAAANTLRIAYPLHWSRLNRQACQEQSVNTAAALARRGHQVTLLMPKGPRDPALTAAEVADYFGVQGEFRLVQRASPWGGTNAVSSGLWLQRSFGDPEVRAADLILSRIPMLLAMGLISPVPFAIDQYRPWTDDLPSLRPLIRRMAARAQCLALIIHSEHAARSYRRAGVPPEKILVAHNGAEPRHMDPPLSIAAARARLGLPLERPIAVYAGRVNRDKGLDQLFAVARLRPNILFLLVGSQGDGAIERTARAVENVRTVPWQEPPALPPWLYAADMLLIPPSRAPLERHGNCVLPMKLFGYLAAGRPIVAPRSPDTAELLEHERTALLVPPGSPAAAAAALDRILADAGLAGRLAAASRQLSEGLSWDVRARRISDFLAERIGAAPRPRARPGSALGPQQHPPAGQHT
ncbi:MAG TPA: glycosyltransferase [Allosphingosinicella sp.]|nr:glycosyltransferase [Allosphingosinicella sp.]